MCLICSNHLRFSDVLPSCDLTGNFYHVQCEGSSCYCVDKDGRELEDSRERDVVDYDAYCKERRDMLDDSKCYEVRHLMKIIIKST